MGFAFNPFTGNFDLKGSGGGASYIDGEVQNFSALPETVGTPPVDSAYLVREAEGAWLLNRKPAGIYIRSANTGVRADDWTHASAFPDVFNDANLVVYSDADSTKNVKFSASGITTGTTRTLTAPDASGTIALTLEYINQSLLSNASVNLAANKHYTFTKDFAGDANLLLPTTANDGDRVVIRRGGGQTSGNLFVVRQGGSPFLQNIGVLTQPNTVFYAVWSGLWRQDFIPPAGFQGTPASPTSTAIAGQMAFEDPYLYVAVGTDTWRRVPVSAW